jgi:hypothetical protein
MVIRCLRSEVSNFAERLTTETQSFFVLCVLGVLVFLDEWEEIAHQGVLRIKTLVLNEGL